MPAHEEVTILIKGAMFGLHALNSAILKVKDVALNGAVPNVGDDRSFTSSVL